MPWVRSEYAGELAVVSAWIAALLPWNVTYARDTVLGVDVSAVFVRFPAFGLQYVFGIETESASVSHPFGSVSGAGGPTDPHALWLVGAVVILLAVALSVALYLREADVERRLPVDPVRATGGLLAVAAVALSAATASFYAHSEFESAIPIPVGLAVLYLLAGALLTADLT